MMGVCVGGGLLYRKASGLQSSHGSDGLGLQGGLEGEPLLCSWLPGGRKRPGSASLGISSAPFVAACSALAR